MGNFNTAFTKIIKNEGGYVNDPNDKGGETYLGISRRYHADSKMWEYIDSYKRTNPGISASKLTAILKKDTRIDDIAKEIYKTQYWNKLRCDEINAQRIAEQFFDMGVNAGLSKAIKLMYDITNEYPPYSVVTDSLIKAINAYGRRKYTRKI